MSFSDAVEASVLNHIYGSTTYTKPAGKFVALFSGAPSDAGGGTEVTTTSSAYARQVIAFTISGTAPCQAANSAQVDFPAATSAWGTITHFAIFDSVTAGIMLNWGPLTTSKTISIGDIMRIPASGIVITLD